MTASQVSFALLSVASCRVADALSTLGVEPGDRVAALMGKGANLVSVMLGTWRLGAVYVPLFTAFAPRAISMRLEDSRTKVVLTDSVLRPKLNPGPDMPP